MLFLSRDLFAEEVIVFQMLHKKVDMEVEVSRKNICLVCVMFVIVMETPQGLWTRDLPPGVQMIYMENRLSIAALISCAALFSVCL